jgi:hypothetical protein
MLPAKTARTRSVGTKLTEEEYGRLESKASERGLTVGEWVRKVDNPRRLSYLGPAVAPTCASAGQSKRAVAWRP